MIAPGFEPRFGPEGQTSAHRRWKWRVLLAFCAFYALSYLGRFNFSLIQTAVIVIMGITRADTGWVNFWMFWGFALAASSTGGSPSGSATGCSFSTGPPASASSTSSPATPRP